MDRPDAARVAVRVTGTVQGVGFRPFVYGLAQRHHLSGFVRNDGGDVYIEVQGQEDPVRRFVEEIRTQAPPLSRIREVSATRLDDTLTGQDRQDFRVIESRRVSGGEPGISPDVSLCPKCRREILDPADRRYLYPFINCTDCGPRFTIVEDIPYDRATTSMRRFVMCPVCAGEYRDPSDRRFHAEPDACWDCGPRVSVYSLGDGTAGTAVAPASPEGDSAVLSGSDREAWIREAQDALRRGEILAVKGVGGFHLACDALNGAAVRELRRRKRRPARPLAIMARDLETAEKWFLVSPQERDLLASPASPIVIVERKPGCPISGGVAPGLDHVGVMLPYSPLHLLLFADLPGRPSPSPALVMTSGNATGMPLVYKEAEAEGDLGPVADRFVVHNRPIVRPCDDSVVRAVLGEPLFYRRSRGYVPGDLAVPAPAGLSVFAAGGEGKNTFCLLRDSRARLSQHLGDLYNEESLARYSSQVKDLARLYRFSPEVLAVDMHPGYRVSGAARSLFPDAPVVTVQHHHAHMVQVMAEHGVTSPCVGIILDGTGYGVDGHVWGGEVLYGGCAGFQRRLRLREVRMPGGEKAVLEPWRMAVSYVKGILGDEGLSTAKRLFPGIQGKIEALWPAADWEGYPLTSSAGRLFDGVSALCGICPVSTYDGESASLLGEAALRSESGQQAGPEEKPAAEGGGAPGEAEHDADVRIEADPADRTEGPVPGAPVPGASPVAEDIDTFPLVSRAIESVLRGERVTEIALEFHKRFAKVLVDAAARVAGETGVRDVVLSGGVFQNPLFLSLAVDYVREMKMRPLWPRAFPPNDGGISLGQAVAAAWMRAGNGER
jgi:hydrogenase maturation protein HypF